MKKLFYISFIIIGLLIVPSSHELLSQITDSCWCVPLSYPRTGQLINQDSAIVFDTCCIRYPYANCDSAFWDNIRWRFYPEAGRKVYAKYFWDVRFAVPAIVLDSVKGDTLLFVTHNAIDSINYPEIKNAFKQLEAIYGSYKLRKVHPDEIAGERSRYFRLYFDNYVKIGEVEYFIDTMKNVSCEFENWPSLTGSDVNDNDINNDFNIVLDPSQTLIKILSKNNLTIKDIEIYNVLGELIYNYNCRACIDNDNFTVNINKYQSGLYIIAINQQINKFYILR